jgi:hypothetical protein
MLFRDSPMGDPFMTFLLLGLIVLFLYFAGRVYLRESFRGAFTTGATQELKESYRGAFTTGATQELKQEGYTDDDFPATMGTAIREDLYVPGQPYATDPIDDLDDYEYSMIFKNEGSRVAGKREISDAMSRYPLDWSNRPPSDEKFQTYREAFVDASQKQPLAATNEFDSISGKDMIPPNTLAIEEEERKLLQTYKPEKAKGFLAYTMEDVEKLIKRIYAKKGLIPTVEKSKQGANVFEIVEVRKKDEPIIWEDELTPPDRYSLRGEEQIKVPQTVNDISAGLDPFYEPRTQTRMDRHDYTRFTPGLERQFAPTYPEKSWF